jgi:hypothetical protein
MNFKILPILRFITQNPGVNLFVGIVFLSTGVIETIASIEEMTVGVHHAAILLGALHTLKHLPDFMEGFEYFQNIGNKDN